MKLLIIAIFAALVVFPTVLVHGLVVNVPEALIFLGVIFALIYSRERLFKALFYDPFSYRLALFTVFALILFAFNARELRDINHTRFHSALPFIAYSLFYSVSETKAIRSLIFNIMCLALLVGIFLNFLVLLRPDLPLWSAFLIGRDLDSAEAFGADNGGRVAGLILGDPIFTAVFCTICIFCGLALFSLSRANLRRAFAFAMIVFGSVFLYYTQTRMVCILTVLLFGYGMGFCFPMFRTLRQSDNFVLLLGLLPFIIKVVLEVFQARGDTDDEITRITAWKSSLEIIISSNWSLWLGTGLYRLWDTFEIWHSHNVWLFTAVVYGLPMALAFVTIYLSKIRELWLLFKVRKRAIRINNLIPDDDDIVIYSTIMVFLFFLLESLFDTTFFQIPRISIFLYALLGMSKAASEEGGAKILHQIRKIHGGGSSLHSVEKVKVATAKSSKTDC